MSSPDAHTLSETWIDWLSQCGFDAHTYLGRHPDLAAGGVDPTTAVRHFVDHGHLERRTTRFAPFPTGLTSTPILGTDATADMRSLVRSVVDSQIRDIADDEVFWRLPSKNIFDAIANFGARPYFAVGDSHARHFVGHDIAIDPWPVGMPLVMHAVSAASLVGGTQPSATGLRLLLWARDVTVRSRNPRDLPIYLTFGGLDAEYRWIARRLRDNIERYSVAQFDTHAEVAVQRYRSFLTLLIGIAGTERIRVCSTFPSVMEGQTWIDNYIQANFVSDSAAIEMRSALHNIEIPGRRERNRLRQRFNTLLATTCSALAATFLDCCTPFLDAGGDTVADVHSGPGSDGFHVCREGVAPFLARAIAEGCAV